MDILHIVFRKPQNGTGEQQVPVEKRTENTWARGKNSLA